MWLSSAVAMIACDDRHESSNGMARFLVSSLSIFDRLEVGMCRALNRTSRAWTIRRTFSLVSRLGDGVFWYTLTGVLAIGNGTDGFLPALHVLLTGAAGVAIYRVVKQFAVRERPFITHSTISWACAPLDRYSFPPGCMMTNGVSPNQSILMRRLVTAVRAASEG